MSTSESKFISVSKASPCPVCEGDHKCSRTADDLFLCGRRTGEQPGFRWLGICKNPIWNMYRRNGDSRVSEERTIGQPVCIPTDPAAGRDCCGTPPDFAALAEDYARNFDVTQERRLAVALGLPVRVFGRLPGIGFIPKENAFTFPERDGNGRICGILRRFPDGSKRAIDKSRRGLTLPGGWADEHGPIFLVEGPSDTLAMAACSLTAIGRFSNAGGATELVLLLKQLSTQRQIVVVGENDAKPDGTWPGKDGAKRLAVELARGLGQPISVTLPPPQYKDVRDWIVDQYQGAAEAFSWEQLGRHVSRDLLMDSVVVQPPAGNDPPALTTADGRKLPQRFPLPVILSELESAGPGGVNWLWDGFLARDAVTLFSALPKCGKTTLISHLLRALGTGGLFCGRAIGAGRALIVSEEPAGVWASRRDDLGIPGDSIRLLPRGVFTRASGLEDWSAFLMHLGELLKDDPADLVIFDTLANLWPVKDENSSSEVTAAMAPLHRLCSGRSVLLVHHLRKSDGNEGTGSRGSGALTGFVDVILELRRQKPSLDPSRRRRVITGYGRYDAIPPEWSIELIADENGKPRFEHIADPGEVVKPGERRQELLRQAVLDLLQAAHDRGEGGMTRKQLWESLPEELRVNEKGFREVLDSGTGNQWTKEERGNRVGGDMYRVLD